MFEYLNILNTMTMKSRDTASGFNVFEMMHVTPLIFFPLFTSNHTVEPVEQKQCFFFSIFFYPSKTSI